MTQAQIKHWNLGRHYLAVGRHDRAIAELRSLLALDAEFLPGHLALISALNQSGAKALALEEAMRLAASHPQSPEAHYWLSFLHLDRQIAQRAILSSVKTMSLAAALALCHPMTTKRAKLVLSHFYRRI